MEESAITVALYAREVAPTEPDPEPSLYLIDKWDGLEKALESDAEVVAVAFPEVLGDHFTELIVNLGKIAESGKRLQIINRRRLTWQVQWMAKWRWSRAQALA